MLLGNSIPFKKLVSTVRRVAPTDATVLLAGESGSGRKFMARLLHSASTRRDGKFVTVECPSIPDELLEAEFFGYQAGAFTGARGPRIGRLEAAHRGTLFLDGVHDLPIRAQTSLLRAIESKEVFPLGASQPRQLDFRVVASAPTNLADRVRRGTFRHDLYYRLKVI